MSKKLPLKLNNPYTHNSSPILQHQNQQYSFLYQQQQNQPLQLPQHQHHAYEYQLHKEEANQIGQIDDVSEGYSHTNTRPHSMFPVQLSGVHQKYLNEESWPLSKKTSRTEVKPTNSKKHNASIKFNKKGGQKQEDFSANIDPLSAGFSSLQIDRQTLLNSLTCRSQFSEQQKGDVFAQLGLKQPKTLGKGRSKRDFQAVLGFLSRGELPAQFVADFVQLLSNCLRQFLRAQLSKYQMNQSSKISFRGTTFRYPVLKPNYKILSFARSLKTTRRGNTYELAQSQDFGLRKYQLQIGSLEHALRQAQWRYDCAQPVLKCLYVQLLSPGCSKTIRIDLYIEHMEMNLYDFSHLLLQEAIYLIVESLKGYKVLFQRYGKVTVAHECIGLCSRGNFAVWMNRFHEKDSAQSRGKKELVKLVKGRCEPVCQKFLGRIQSFIFKNKPDWAELLDFLRRFILNNQIKVPANLKYLLNQHRIKQNVTSIKTSRNQNFQLPEESGEISIVIKSPRFHYFVPSKIRTRKNSNNIQTPKDVKKGRKYSAVEPTLMKLNRLENMRDRIESSVSLNPKMSSRNHSCMESDDKSDIIKTLRKFEASEDGKQKGQKKGHLRVKSQSIDNSNSLCFLSPFDEYRDASKLHKISGMSQITRAGNSRAKSNERQNKQNIYYLADTVKKIKNKDALKLESLPFRQVQHAEIPLFEEIQYLQSPLACSPQQSLQPTFKCIPQAAGEDVIKQQIYSMNNWTKTFKSLMNSGADINVSITDGKEVSTYLSDVKLTHLDRLSHQMVESMIHDSSESDIEYLRQTTG